MASPLCRGWCWPSRGSRHRRITWPILCLHCSRVRWEWLSRSGWLTPRGFRLLWRLEWASGFSARPVSCSEHSPLLGRSTAVSSSVLRSSWADFWWEQASTHFQHLPRPVQPSLNVILRRTETPSKGLTPLVGTPSCPHTIISPPVALTPPHGLPRPSHRPPINTATSPLGPHASFATPLVLRGWTHGAA